MPGLADPGVRGTSARDSEGVGNSLQPGTSPQFAGAWRTGSAAGAWGGPEVRIPTSIGGGCARACEIGAGRLASRVFARNGNGGCVMDDRETDGRVRRATFLRSTGRARTAAATTITPIRWSVGATASSRSISTCPAARRPRNSSSTASSSCRTRSGAPTPRLPADLAPSAIRNVWSNDHRRVRYRRCCGAGEGGTARSLGWHCVCVMAMFVSSGTTASPPSA